MFNITPTLSFRGIHKLNPTDAETKDIRTAALPVERSQFCYPAYTSNHFIVCSNADDNKLLEALKELGYRVLISKKLTDEDDKHPSWVTGSKYF